MPKLGEALFMICDTYVYKAGIIQKDLIKKTKIHMTIGEKTIVSYLLLEKWYQSFLYIYFFLLVILNNA